MRERERCDYFLVEFFFACLFIVYISEYVFYVAVVVVVVIVETAYDL